jgi:hypothetical protein
MPAGLDGYRSIPDYFVRGSIKLPSVDVLREIVHFIRSDFLSQGRD